MAVNRRIQSSPNKMAQPTLIATTVSTPEERRTSIAAGFGVLEVGREGAVLSPNSHDEERRRPECGSNQQILQHSVAVFTICKLDR